MTVASEIQRIEGNISAAYTAADAKGATILATENSDNLATCIASIPSGGSSGKYALLDRVKDDSNNEIGTVSGFFTDANDVEYAVVCLDAQYRNLGLTWCSNSSTAVTNLPQYSNQTLYSTTETATFNTQKILDFCIAQSATSTACSHCRNKSFIIDGTTYYGQLPNIVEVIDIYRHSATIDSMDTSINSYPNVAISNINFTPWSSNQFNAGNAWYLNGGGYIDTNSKTNTRDVIPVLEIPVS